MPSSKREKRGGGVRSRQSACLPSNLARFPQIYLSDCPPVVSVCSAWHLAHAGSGERERRGRRSRQSACHPNLRASPVSCPCRLECRQCLGSCSKVVPCAMPAGWLLARLRKVNVVTLWSSGDLPHDSAVRLRATGSYSVRVASRNSPPRCGCRQKTTTLATR